jgi:sulfoxide reductase heme-binding subunit YedZ
VSPTSLTDPSQHLFWLASRALGVVAIVLLSAAVACGLALSGRMSGRPGGTARLKTAHEALTLTALGAIAGHGLVLLGDSYLAPGVGGIAVPFVLAFKQFWTGLGVIGGWLAAILGLSYYARRWIGVSTWRKLHRWTLLAYVLAVAHTLGSGTDASSGWLLAILAAAGLPVIAIGLKRVAERSPANRPAPARGLDRSGPSAV